MSKAWKNFEREIARVFKELGFKVKRLWEEQFEEGGSIDVEALREDYFFDIQCKYTSDKGKLSHSLKVSWEEANQTARNNRIPLGIVRLRSVGTWVVIGYHDFLELLKEDKD